ncbi:hypothetical protein BCR35DRAFT_311094 [Leucosporidium creatinivorum]|uniref:ER membrane protein complex subunit 1 n=1 Tax=Leucosporidium creatinivorum TaxID=106004 RepID=A0A1Y2CGI7_9BASI|nr:hypothetical protein BCR35DRAFT_311094 [Leucosporidium creatinivorum]
MKDWSTLALGAILSLAAPAWAIQASEVGRLDWHLPLIGPPQLSSPVDPPLHRFHHTSTSAAPNASKKSLLLTYTVKNVLAALEPSTGDVVWRRRYPSNHPNARHLSCSASSVIVLSGASGSDLASLNGSTGAVEWSLSGAEGREGQALCWNDGSTTDILWLTKDGVRRIDGITGGVIWARNNGAESKGSLRLVQIDAERFGVLDISPQDEQPALSLQLIDARQGSLVGQPSSAKSHVQASNALTVKSRAVDGPTSTLVWVESGRLLSLKLGDKLDKPSRLAASTSASAQVAQVRDVGLSHLGIFVAHYEDGTAAVITSVGEDWSVDPRVPLCGLRRPPWGSSYRPPLVLLIPPSESLPRDGGAPANFPRLPQLGSFQIYSLAATEASPAGMLTGHTFPFDQDKFGSLITFAFEASPPNAYTVATRSYISTSSGVTQAWEGSHLVWHKEESLSTVDSPALYWDVAETVQHDSSSSLLADSSLPSRLRRHVNAISRIFDQGVQSKPTAPASNGRQLVFVASSAFRTIFALDLAQQGRIVWRACIDGRAGSWDPFQRLRMLDLDDGRPRVSITLIKDAETASVSLVELDALTGTILDVDSSTPAVSAAFSQVMDKQQHVSDKITLDVSGTSIAGVSRSQFGIKTSIWTAHLPEREQVLAVAIPRDGVVASTGRILGDRSTLLKYLNPNMIAVATFSPATRSSSVLLMNSESGALLHKIGPIADVDDESNLSLALQDNWLVLTYRVAGEAARASKVVSVELYTSGDDSLGMLGVNLERIQALTRTFVSTQALEIKSFTRTKLGITTYNALFANSLGQIVAVPRRFLDPRRTLHKPTKQDQEELLLPYEALLPADPRWTLSHRREVEGLNKIESFAGRLESESLVLASGLDLFGTRVSPSRSFDVLSPTFNKAQLVITITALSLGLAVTRSMVKGRQVHQKWYFL